MSTIIVLCRARKELSIEELRGWLERRAQPGELVHVSVVEHEAREHPTWLVEVDVDQRSIHLLDEHVGELVTDLRLLGLSPALFMPDR